MGQSTRSGSVLLEAMVALAVLGTIGSAVAWKTAEALRAVSHVRAREADLVAAHRFMNAVSLWPREDLDLRLGSRQQGPWTMYVERIRPDLYDVVLEDAASGRAVLRTTLLKELEGTP